MFCYAVIKWGFSQERILSDRLYEVVNAYEHALLGMFPRARYAVGWDAKSLLFISNLMPEWYTDFMIRINAGEVIPQSVQDKRHKVKRK